MSRWFRFYADALRNPKVMRLSDKEFRLWVRLMAVASENDGAIPALDDLKLLLNSRLDHLSTGVERLISGGLIDALGNGYEPHNWAKFQYKSDTSNERVAKHRAKRNVTVTASETEAETERVVATATTAGRAARIRADWVPEKPLPATVQKLVDQWPDGRRERELEGFRDYWATRSRDAAKLDWDKAWWNRIRDQHDRILRENRHGQLNLASGAGRQPDAIRGTILRAAVAREHRSRAEAG